MLDNADDPALDGDSAVTVKLLLSAGKSCALLFMFRHCLYDTQLAVN
jgi:hypothetical protein